ncbi:MAG: mucoidy inhibitor MuiA family protein [Thermodesulfobacteriota bacterium]|nr:mucoidy inhibitor MuiA family protein [Thermodesulfobacteriota bacterium]
MRPKFFFSMMMATLLCLAVSTGPVLATPSAVTLFPEGGTVTEQAILTAGANTVTIPARALPATLSVQVKDKRFTLAGATWERVEIAHPETTARLKQQIESLKQKKAAAADTRKAVAAKITFWEHQLARDWEKSDDALAVGAALETPLLQGYQQQTGLSRQIEEMDKEIAELEKELKKLTSGQENQWAVRIALSGPADVRCPVEFSYFFPECGFAPAYRLNAAMAKNAIDFSWDADIWQNSGVSWEKVEMTLTTASPSFELVPPDLLPWIIQERPQAPVYRSSMLMAEKSVADAMTDQAAALQPQPVLKSTATEWRMGKRSVPSGEKQRFLITSRSLPARFLHLVRPSRSTKAFVVASVTLKEPLQAPEGEAIFLIDGTMVGRGPFSMEAREATLFFGQDPLVSATKTLVLKKRGKEGLIATEQTVQWQWAISLENHHPYDVTAQVEEPRPQTRDKAIKTTWTLDPAVSEKKSDHQTFVWEIALPAGKTQAIQMDVQVNAPADMDLMPGM